VARAAVETEMICARRNYSRAKKDWDSDWPFDNACHVRTWILHVFLVYARQVINLGAKDVWTVDRVLAEALEGLRLIAIEVAYPAGFGYWVDNWGGSIKSDVMSQLEATTEWAQFEDELLVLAESKREGVQDHKPNKLLVPVKTNADVVPTGDSRFPPALTVGKARSKADEPKFPDRATWLNERLRERGWNKHDVSRQGGPDHKTVQKILDGERVREDALEKMALALSKVSGSKKLPTVNLLDIPQT
jgi:hypothetical protein